MNCIERKMKVSI